MIAKLKKENSPTQHSSNYHSINIIQYDQNSYYQILNAKRSKKKKGPRTPKITAKFLPAKDQDYSTGYYTRSRSLFFLKERQQRPGSIERGERGWIATRTGSG